jgi:hypothetical protein
MVVATSELKQAVERTHGGIATYVQSVPVQLAHNGVAVWDGTVYVFDLSGHPSGTRVYAWSATGAGSEKRRFNAVLHRGRIIGPTEAVRAVIALTVRTVE